MIAPSALHAMTALPLHLEMAWNPQLSFAHPLASHRIVLHSVP